MEHVVCRAQVLRQPQHVIVLRNFECHTGTNHAKILLRELKQLGHTMSDSYGTY